MGSGQPARPIPYTRMPSAWASERLGAPTAVNLPVHFRQSETITQDQDLSEGCKCRDGSAGDLGYSLRYFPDVIDSGVISSAPLILEDCFQGELCGARTT
jgi:hypothetical protein